MDSLAFSRRGRPWNHALAGLLVLGGAWMAGCGSSGNGYSNFMGDAGGNDIDGTIVGDDGGNGGSSSGSSSGGGGTCATGCTSDQACQSSCPAAQSGSINCCDIPSGTCMMMAQSTCPAPSDGGAE